MREKLCTFGRDEAAGMAMYALHIHIHRLLQICAKMEGRRRRRKIFPAVSADGVLIQNSHVSSESFMSLTSYEFHLLDFLLIISM